MRRLTLVIVAGVAWFAGCAPDSSPEEPAASADAADANGQPGPVLGVVDFPVSCNNEAQAAFDIGVAQLHHMMYEQANPYFEAAAEADPDCAMAHWGIAMTSFYPLWTPTPGEQLARGQAAVETARAIGAPSDREAGFIAAVEAFFTDPEPPRQSVASDHAARVEAWRTAQQELHEAYPDDVEAAAFYALSEVAYAQTRFAPTEEPDFTRQRRAGALLEGFLDEHPEHPGVFHYVIHAYDSAELAPLAEEVARGYDRLAPNTTHALHMPSHIFVRLGQWEETVDWNERAAAAALEQAESDPQAMMHYVHALDYRMYGSLQLGDDERARTTLERIQAVAQAPPGTASAYGLAAPQARYYLERGQWEEAAALEPGAAGALDWEQFPEAAALFAYARGLGTAHIGDLEQARAESERIEGYVGALREAGNEYWAYTTEALGGAVAAWVLYEEGQTAEALARMRAAADLEDSMEKHPITPGEVFPVRELYAELLLREGRAEEARAAFEASLARTPNRRNALAGVERAAAAVEPEVAGER